MRFALKDAHFVIHAAAQKHIEKFELDIPQGYKTNIQGTQNVAEGFLESKNAVSAIFVSTDKACLPITPYGVLSWPPTLMALAQFISKEYSFRCMSLWQRFWK